MSIPAKSLSNPGQAPEGPRMNNAAAISDVMPAMVKHAGSWEGVYTHLDAAGSHRPSPGERSLRVSR